MSVEGTIRDGFGLGALAGPLNLPAEDQERVESGLPLVQSSHEAKN